MDIKTGWQRNLLALVACCGLFLPGAPPRAESKSEGMQRLETHACQVQVVDLDQILSHVRDMRAAQEAMVRTWPQATRSAEERYAVGEIQETLLQLEAQVRGRKDQTLTLCRGQILAGQSKSSRKTLAKQGICTQNLTELQQMDHTAGCLSAAITRLEGLRRLKPARGNSKITAGAQAIDLAGMKIRAQIGATQTLCGRLAAGAGKSSIQQAARQGLEHEFASPYLLLVAFD